MIQSVSLLSLTDAAFYLKAGYYAIVVAIIVSGVLTLTFQNCEKVLWVQSKRKISLLLNTAGVFLFVISQQPYAATFLLIFLIIKALILIKRQ